MSKYLHYDFFLESSDVVEIELSKQANVRLMDDHNYSNYRHGRKYQFFGGLAQRSPVRVSPPHDGHWNLVIDLQGFVGTVNASVRVIR